MNNFSVLPFYQSVAEQNHRLPYAYGAVYPLYCDDTRILPFQIIRPTRQNTITSVILFDKDGTQVRDLTSDMSFDIVALDDYDVIVYTAQFGYAQELPIGQYYISVSDGAQTWYSDIFTIVSDITPYVKLEWYDEENFVMDAGTIIYNNPRFINRLYLNTEIGKPDYQFEEEGEQRDGYFFPEKQLSEKTYRFTILAPEYLCDVMRFIRMADHIQITADGYTYNADTFLFTPKWQTQGDLASVEVEFESNTVAKKLGDARVRRTMGDFNDDYNDDYEGCDTPVPPVPPTPVEEAPENDVCFYDYDGFRVASYSITEAKALTALPTPPSHEGLTFQQWNWTLNDISTYNRQYIDVGANYITEDGQTHITVVMDYPNADINFSIRPVGGVAIVSFGDGSPDVTCIGFTNVAHTYNNKGIYKIKVSCSDESHLQIDFSTFYGKNRNSLYRVKEVNVGGHTSTTYPSVFYALACKISIPKNGCISSFDGVCANCIVIPRDTSVLLPAINYLFNTTAKICFPKVVPSSHTTRFCVSSGDSRIVLSEYTDGQTASVGSFSRARIISVPSSFVNQDAALFYAAAYLSFIDIVQGWTPTHSLTINSSTVWSAENMVDFFTKLGTTQTAITLTFGSTNLNKLTADQKAIATGKGYTLA